MEKRVASGERIAAQRRALGLSQEAVAQAGGVTRQAVGAIESGRTQPSVALALAIARALNASVEELFGGEADEDIARRAGEPQPQSGQRVVLATIGSRRIVRNLDQASPGCALEPAGAIVIDSRPQQTRVRILDTAAHDDPVLVSGCDVSLGLLVRHLDARRARGVWFAASNTDALNDLAAGRTHVAAIHGPEAERKRVAGVHRFDLAGIEEGWLVARGNPHRFRGARDLAVTASGSPIVRPARQPDRSSMRSFAVQRSTRAALPVTSVSSRVISTSLAPSSKASPTWALGSLRRRGCSIWSSSRCARSVAHC